MLKIVLCDDEVSVLDALSVQIKGAFSRLGLDVSIQTFSSAELLYQNFISDSPDAFFLDIDMPEMDGVDLGVALRKRVNNACIVYISNREDRVYDTFRASPTRFIRKSRFREEIDEAAKAVKTWWEQNKNRYLVNVTRGQVLSFLIDDILYVECFNKEQNVITKTQTKTIKTTMSEMEDKLLGFGFLNPCKGYLVNFKYIDSIETTGIVLKNGVVIPISKRKITETKNAFLKLVSAEPGISATCLHKP